MPKKPRTQPLPPKPQPQPNYGRTAKQLIAFLCDSNMLTGFALPVALMTACATSAFPPGPAVAGLGLMCLSFSFLTLGRNYGSSPPVRVAAAVLALVLHAAALGVGLAVPLFADAFASFIGVYAHAAAFAFGSAFALIVLVREAMRRSE